MKYLLIKIGAISIAGVLMPSSWLYAARPAIGYGSSTAVVTAKTQEGFFMGFQLGFEKSLGPSLAREMLLVKQVTDGTPLGAVRSAEALLSQGSLALIGFPGSHDSLLVADIAKKRGILALFSGSGHTDLAKKGNTVFTTGASMERGLEATLKFLSRIYPGKRGLVIVNPYSVFSMNQETILSEIKTRPDFSKIHVETARLTKELTLRSDLLLALKKKQYEYLFLTPYPEELTIVLDQLSENLIDLPMVAGSSWGTADPEIMRRFLVQSHSPFYMAAEWFNGQPESIEFRELVLKKYGKEGTSEMAFGYDVGIIIATVVNRAISSGPISKESLLMAFRRNPCFDGLTVGRICFDPNGGHAKRKITMLQFTKNGFTLMKDSG